MTTQQKESFIEKIQSYAFPALLLIVVYFLQKMDDKLEKLYETSAQLKTQQELLSQQIHYLRNDTSTLRYEVEALKKNLGE